MSHRYLPMTSIGLLALLCVALAGCSKSSAPVETPPPKVTVSQPIERKVVDYDTYSGYTDAVETLEVRSRVRGHLEKIYFQDGQEVEDGDLLFLIDPEPFKAALASAEAQLDAAEAAHKLAKAEYERTRILFRKGAASQEDLDVATGKKGVAAADVDKALAAVREARINLDFTEIRARISGQPRPATGAGAAALMASPLAPGPLLAASVLLSGRTRGKGKIGRPLVTVGNLVNASGGEQVLTTIVTIDPVYVYFDVDEGKLLRYLKEHSPGKRGGEQPPLKEMKINMEVRLEGEEGFPHKGLIDYADPKVSSTTGTIKVRGVLPNAARILAPGLRATVRVPASDPFQALLVTERAIGTDQSLRFVWIVNDKKEVERRDVKLGRQTDDGLRVIQDGLKATDWVVVNGIQRVRDGITVEPRRVPMPTQPTESEAQPLPGAKEQPAPSTPAKSEK
jgi:multidrug efflux pump subunit AcrA (membrane-fusion protein)